MFGSLNYTTEGGLEGIEKLCVIGEQDIRNHSQMDGARRAGSRETGSETPREEMTRQCTLGVRVFKLLSLGVVGGFVGTCEARFAVQRMTTTIRLNFPMWPVPSRRRGVSIGR
jgi:nitrate reductase NapE component